jgi:hypothetical protein
MTMFLAALLKPLFLLVVLGFALVVEFWLERHMKDGRLKNLLLTPIGHSKRRTENAGNRKP